MVSHKLDRRRFLRGAAAVGAVGLANAALRSPFSVVRASVRAMEQEAKSRFAPVKVARNRIIREVVGLRPYRAEGFVVEAERLGDKLLVHNYGHGGAGVTLSWGTSSLAVDLAREFLQTGVRPQPVRTSQSRTVTQVIPTPPRIKIEPARPLPQTMPARPLPQTMPARPLPQAVLTGSRGRGGARRFAVLGCGVMGLSTARLVQRRLLGEGGTVTIYAKDIPPQTTSNVAGALWLPTSIYNPELASAKFLEQFHLAARLSNRAFQELVGVEYGVRWTDTYELITGEASLNRELSGGAALYPQTEFHRNPEQYFGVPFVRQFSTMMIEPHTYLRALLRDFYLAGGKIVIKEFKNREEVARLSEQVIFNCTGLGARDLFGDEKLGPVRGQLEVLLPQPEIDYCYLSGSSYMFPRRDGIILGGTFDHDDWSLEPNAEQATEILEAHAGIMKKAEGTRQ
jgi:glycine/D-amino acid oxidase-like deaminating enzyme